MIRLVSYKLCWNSVCLRKVTNLLVNQLIWQACPFLVQQLCQKQCDFSIDFCFRSCLLGEKLVSRCAESDTFETCKMIISRFVKPNYLERRLKKLGHFLRIVKREKVLLAFRR